MKLWSLAVAVLMLARLSLAQQLSVPFILHEAVRGPPGGAQRAPAVTWTGSSFFVVWSDDRDGRSSDLWFRTFSAQGQPLDALSAPLLRAPRHQQSPSASSGAGAVLVAWLDDTVCASEVMAQRFLATGQAAGPLTRLSTGACTGNRPSVAWDLTSSQWLVAWGSHGIAREVHGAIVAADGSVAVSDFVIASGPNSATNPTVVSLPLGPVPFQVAWSDDRLDAGQANLFAVSVSSTGVVGAASQVRPSAAVQRSPCSAPHGAGSDVLISWVEGTEVLAQLVSNAGVPSGSATVVTSGPLTEVSCVSGPGGAVLLASTDTRATGPGVYLRTFEADGGVSAEFDAAPRFSSFGRDTPRLAVSGADALLVTRGPWGYVTGDDIIGRAVSLGPISADAGVFLVANGGTQLSKVSAAFDGARYLTVWRDDGQSFAGSDSFGQLLEAGTGRPLVDGGLRFSANSANLVSYPSVGGSDAGFFVSRGDEGSAGLLMGARVSSLGAISPSVRLSDLSSYVNTHLSRWLLDGWATTFLKSGTLRVRRTSNSGALVLPETVLVPTGGAPEQLDSASLDDVLLSVFLARDAGLDVWGARFEADAGLVDPLGFAITNLAGDEIDPAVGAGANLFLVAWSKGGDVFATRVTRQGALLDAPPLQVSAGPAADLLPAVGWTGQNFLVAFQRDGDVVAVRVSESGALLDATPMIIAASAEVDRAPRVASGRAEALVTWEAFTQALGSFEALGRFVAESSADAGTGVADAGAPDAGTPDAGTPDAGDVDAGAPDAGDVDAGAPDAGESDAGPPDDAGVDAGENELDAGSAGPARTYGVGCGCAGTAELAFALSLLLARRRR